MVATIPVVEVANDRDATGTRSPDGKSNAINSLMFSSESAEFLIDAMVGPLIDQVEVLFAQAGEK